MTDDLQVGYCASCKTAKAYPYEVKVATSGRRTAEGKCPTCGNKISRVVGKR